MVEEAVKTNNLQFLIDMNLQGDDLNYSLHFASIYGSMNIAIYLLSQGADINASNGLPLQWACIHGQLDLVKYYVANGAIVGSNDNWAVICAGRHGYIDIIKYLISQGADVTTHDNQAVKWASDNDHIDTVKYLINHGADVTKITSKMWKNMCATRIKQFYKRQYTRRRLWRVMKDIMPIYYHPKAKGGYFARKAILECC
jgi:ankyrin repeat protein